MQRYKPLILIVTALAVSSVIVAGLSTPQKLEIQQQSIKAASPPVSIIKSEFIFETAPFASAHASTIVETREGLVAAWFGGTREGTSDVVIWLSRQLHGVWTNPVEVAHGIGKKEMKVKELLD